MNLSDIRLSVVCTYAGTACEAFGEGFDMLTVINTRHAHGEDTITTYRHAASDTLWTVTDRRYDGYNAIRREVEIYATCDTDLFDGLCYDLPVPGKRGHVSGILGDEVGNYAEFAADLTQAPLHQEATDGRPTHGYFPYYRVETDTESFFCVISWQGTWFADFTQEEDAVRIRAGQRGVHTRLLAGERFRLPAVLILPYEDDPVRLWRHFFADCIMPPVKGQRIRPMIGAFNGACCGLNREFVNRVKGLYDAHSIPYDLWWFDAGWGTDGTGPHNKEGWWYSGLNIEMNEVAFPDGIAFLGDELRAEGKDFLLWFEPELLRTVPEEMEGFFAYHPEFKREWLVGTSQKEWCGIILTARLFDLGNPACRAWVEQHVFEVMDRSGATIYRQDFNIGPAGVWAEADAEDRRGMTENRYCGGYVQFLRDIAARYPGILMDSCASGGGRFDLGTLEIMHPLHYSDHQDYAPGDLNGHIYMQQVLFRYFPYLKNNVTAVAMASKYGMRSVTVPFLSCALSPEEMVDENFATMSELIAEWQAINPAFEGEYFELTPATRDDEHVKGYGFWSEENNKGFAMVFFPSACTEQTFCVRPRYLIPTATYCVRNCDSGERFCLSGEVFMTEGVTVTGGAMASRLLVFSVEA